MKKWFLLYTRPRQEKLALQHLQNQGFMVYLPLVLVERIRKGVRTLVEEVLFPRYLFVQLDEAGSQSWAPIRSTIGVSQMVKFGAQFVHVSHDLVAWLQEYSKVVKLAPELKQGDVVMIVEGPFKGMDAIFKAYDGEKRAILLLNLLTKMTEANFGLNWIKKAS